MAVKYYSDGTYTKGDGKLYYGNVLVGTDKSTNVSKAESGSSTPVTTTSSNKSSSSSSSSSSKKSSSSSSSSNKSSSNSSSNKSNYTEEVWEANGRKYVNGIDIGPAGTKVDTSNSTELINEAIRNNNSGSSSSSQKQPEVEENPYEQAYKDLQNLLNSNEERYKEQLGSLEQKYNDLLNAPNPYEQKYNEIQEAYKKQEEAIREQNRLAVEQGTNRLNAQKTNINQAANDNARQAYIMQMQAKKALPQQLAGQGATGGATETANLGLQTTYQNNLNDINRNKVNAIQEIDNAIVDLQTTGDLSAVEQVLANNQAALNAYSANLDKSVAYNQWAQQFNANRADALAEQAYRDKVYANQMAQQTLQNEWYEREYADTLKQYEDKIKQQALQNEMWQKEYDAEQKKYKDTLNQKNQQLANEQKTILNNISDTAFAMYKSEEYTPQDVIAYITGQSALTDQQQYDILKSLGLI
jgi:hypothetical protein